LRLLHLRFPSGAHIFPSRFGSPIILGAASRALHTASNGLSLAFIALREVLKTCDALGCYPILLERLSPECVPSGAHIFPSRYRSPIILGAASRALHVASNGLSLAFIALREVFKTCVDLGCYPILRERLSPECVPSGA
jgi:SNF family Na+-dependent transporter